MNENLILTKESVPSDIERYFRGVLALDQQDKVFSVNLDDVWRLAYNRKDAAVRALKANFIENVDYLTLPKMWSGQKMERLLVVVQIIISLPLV